MVNLNGFSLIFSSFMLSIAAIRVYPLYQIVWADFWNKLSPFCADIGMQETLFALNPIYSINIYIWCFMCLYLY